MAEPSSPNSDAALLALLNRGLAIIDGRGSDLSKEILSMADRPSLKIPKGLLDDDIATSLNAESASHDFGFRNFLLLLQLVRMMRSGAGAAPTQPIVSVEES